MGSTDKFCLRWNDFETNISSAFKDIRNSSDFFDVTLACDDTRQLQAHKLILSACSPFFRRILTNNPHQNPLLYLKGVRYSDLEAILNFMYHGEVNVSQDELNSFLAVAEDLCVKGLTTVNDNVGQTGSKAEKRPGTTLSSSSKRIKKSGSGSTTVATSKDSENVTVKAEPRVSSHPAESNNDFDYNTSSANNDDFFETYDDDDLDPSTSGPKAWSEGSRGSKSQNLSAKDYEEEKFLSKEPESFEIIEDGTIRGAKLWISGKYSYIKDHKAAKKLYLRCRWSGRQDCKGRAVLQEQHNLFFMTKPHTCVDSL